jgi:hypothetical protein
MEPKRCLRQIEYDTIERAGWIKSRLGWGWARRTKQRGEGLCPSPKNRPSRSPRQLGKGEEGGQPSEGEVRSTRRAGIEVETMLG